VNGPSPRWSARLPWGQPANRLTRAAGARRARGEALDDLTESNPTAVGLALPDATILAGLGHPGALRYTPDPRGLARAREAVARYYGERGSAVDAGRIHLACGTSEAYGWLLKLLADPGDNVLAPRPSYPLLEFLAALEGVELRSYRLVERSDGRWIIDLDSLAAGIDARTRAVLLVNPNNPTGSFARRGQLPELVGLCAGRGLALIADEVFSDFVLREDADQARTLVEIDEGLVFVLGGLSKTLGLPQMKLAWIVAGGAPALRRQAQERLDWIADTYLSVGAPVQHAAVEWLRLRSTLAGPIAARVRGNLEQLERQLAGRAAARLVAPEGGWYAVLELPQVASEEDFVVERIERDGVLVHPGHFFDFSREAFVVISLLPEPRTLRAGMQRLLDATSPCA
jgi:hypothetical protein